MNLGFVNPLLRDEEEFTLKLDEIEGDDQVWVVWLLPSNKQLKSRGFELSEINASPCVIMTMDARNARFSIHPFYTAPNLDVTYNSKYPWLFDISFDWSDPMLPPNEETVYSLLGSQPEQFIQSLDYGLGIKQGYRSLMRTLRELTGAKSVYIGDGKAIANEFKIDGDQFQGICAEIKRIDSRAKKAENEVKDTTVFNMLAPSAGKEQRPFRLGRNEIRQLIQKFAADPDYRDLDGQKALVTEVGRAARSIAIHSPEMTDKFVSALQTSRLEIAITNFETLLGQKHNESKWQAFFEEDPFLLTFAFGYPVSFLNGQSYVGGRRIDGKGEKNW